MVKIRKSLYFFKITEIWFEYKFRLSDLFFPVIYKDIKKIDQKFYFGFRNYDYSAELSLAAPVEEIFSSFKTTVRTEIRKAEREGTECFFHEDLDGFIDFYNDFAPSKNLGTTNRKRMDEIGDNLKISYATLNGKVLAAHSYIEDKELGVVRSLHSASKRFDETLDRNQIARANKLLHFKDMQYFKERGIKKYDFGSYQIGDGAKGLLEFKESLGGQKVTNVFFMTYSYYFIQRLQQMIAGLKKSTSQK